MLVTAITFLSNLWIAYDAIIVNCLFWAVIGIALLSPALLVEAVYKSRKVGDMYHFREGYHLKRAKHRKDVKIYGLTSMILLISVVVIEII